MSVTIINLKTDGYHASTEELEKYEVYSRVSFNINPHTKFDNYGSVPVEFYREYTQNTLNLLTELGFTGVDFETGIKPGGACLTVTRGEENLYLNPTQISGIIKNMSIGEVKATLEKSALFDLWESTTHDMVDMPTADAIELVRRNSGSIANALLRISSTPRVNKYKPLTACLTAIASYHSYNKSLKINGEEGLICSLYVGNGHRETVDAVFNEVRELANTLIESGRLVKVASSGQTYVRSLNKGELKKWNAMQCSRNVFEERKSA